MGRVRGRGDNREIIGMMADFSRALSTRSNGVTFLSEKKSKKQVCNLEFCIQAKIKVK